MLIKVFLTIDMGKLKAQTNGLGCAPSITLAEDSLFADFNLEELFPFLSCETHKSQTDKKSQTELAKGQEALRFNKERLFCSAFLEVCSEVCYSEVCPLNNLNSLLITVR